MRRIGAVKQGAALSNSRPSRGSSGGRGRAQPCAGAVTETVAHRVAERRYEGQADANGEACVADAGRVAAGATLFALMVGWLHDGVDEAEDDGRQLGGCRFEIGREPGRALQAHRDVPDHPTGADQRHQALPRHQSGDRKPGERNHRWARRPRRRRWLSPSQHCGFGLLGMCERVQLLHAAVQIGSSSGEGTPVTAGLPQRRPGPAATAGPPDHPPNRYGCGPLSEEQVRVRRDGRC